MSIFIITFSYPICQIYGTAGHCSWYVRCSPSQAATDEYPDTGEEKKKLCLNLGADHWVDFKESKDIVADITALTGGLGAHSAVVTAATVYRFLLAVNKPEC